MPLHDFQCPLGHTFEVWESPKDIRQTRFCLPWCTWMAQKVFLAPPLIRGDLPSYQSPIDGRWVDGRVARQRDLNRHGMRAYDEGEREEAVRRNKKEEEQFENALDQTIEETISKMPARKREQLAAEMENGVDVELVRQSSN